MLMLQSVLARAAFWQRPDAVENKAAADAQARTKSRVIAELRPHSNYFGMGNPFRIEPVAAFPLRRDCMAP